MEYFRILLVDDHSLTRASLGALSETEAGGPAPGIAEEHSLDVVVMDISMPGPEGTEAITRICQAFPDKKILALTAHDDPPYLQALLNAGASGYVLKHAAAQDLIRAIRDVAKGLTYIDPGLPAQLVSHLNTKPVSDSGVFLSERECEVLRYVSQGHALKTIAGQLDVGVRTVETYKTRGMEKLGLRSRAELVRYASEQGWLKSIE